MELKDSLGLNLSPAAFSLEVSGPDGQSVEIDSDSALTTFFRRSLRRFEQLPEQDFILGESDARKRRGKTFNVFYISLTIFPRPGLCFRILFFLRCLTYLQN
jgi:hypothetical protein